MSNRIQRRCDAVCMSQSTLDMRGSLICLLGVLAAGLMSNSAFAASQRDVSSTHTVLLAANSTLQSVIRTWPAMEASLHRLDRKFAAECPDVGAGSPQSEAEQNLSYEVAGALWATAYHADSRFAQAFIKAVSPLRWSNPTIGRTAHKFIRGLREMTSLAGTKPLRRRALMDGKRLQDNPVKHAGNSTGT